MGGDTAMGSASANSDPAPKVRAIGSGKLGSDPDTKALLVALAKLGLSNDQASRMFKAILLRCIKVPTIHPMQVAAKTTSKQWTDRRADMGQQAKERLGPCHVHVFNSSIGWMLLHAKKPDIKKLVQDYLDVKKTMPILIKELRHFRYASMYDKESRRLEWCAAEGSDTQKLLYALEQEWLEIEDFSMLPPMPPPGDQARKVQAWLDSVAPQKQ